MDRKLSPESRHELETLRASLRANDGEALRFDAKRRSFRWWRADQIDYRPETLPGFVPTEDEQQAMREALDAKATTAWLNRDPREKEILGRWNLPEEELDVLEELDETDSRGVWVERFTDFRRTQLHALLTDYFGASDYRRRNIVLRWEQKNGRWVPAEQMNVLAWIEQRVEDKGSRLSGFSSCAGTIRQKLARRRRKPEAVHYH
jgi:hypothetical protein